MFNDEYISLTPVSFFSLSFDCLQLSSAKEIPLKNFDKFLLPDTSVLCNEKPFATVAMGWNKEGIAVQINLNKAFEESFYPEFTQGDSVELFFDTRDVKTSGFNTRFCHHFFFLPKSIEGHTAGEVTRFRTEDAHPLCDSTELIVNAQFKRNSYSMKIFIPNHCLNGYDPEQFDHIGFTYRINRPGEKSQHFSAVTDDYQIDQQPSLWSSARLV